MTRTAAIAGGGLLIAATGTVPAYGAAPVPPGGAHTATISAHPRAWSGIGTGPRAVLPCAERRGADIRPAICSAQTITCRINAPAPQAVSPHQIIDASAQVHCDHPVFSMGMQEFLVNHSRILEEDDAFAGNSADMSTFTEFSRCLPATYTNTALANIYFPDGYSPPYGYIHQTNDFVAPPAPPGGGCVITAPSSPMHPAAIRPDLISCS
jgi:hypothetical protein